MLEQCDHAHGTLLQWGLDFMVKPNFMVSLPLTNFLVQWGLYILILDFMIFLPLTNFTISTIGDSIFDTFPADQKYHKIEIPLYIKRLDFMVFFK